MAETFYTYASLAAGVLLFLPLWRVAKGPTVFDRVLATAVMGTKTMVLLLLMGFAAGRPDMYVDMSIGYGLALLVGGLATAKYFERSGGAAAQGSSR